MDDEFEPETQAVYDKAFERGRRARTAGLALRDNPYREDPFKHRAWRQGWTDQDQSLLVGGQS